MSAAQPRAGREEQRFAGIYAQSVMCPQLCRKEDKENSNNRTTRSIGFQTNTPFRDITNVVASRRLSKGKQAQKFLQSMDHPIIGTQHSINPSGISVPCIQTREPNTPSIEHTDIVPTNASEHKHYHDRERYLRMNPEQREAYLQRNREYKRRRRNYDTRSDNVQSAMSQTNKSTNGSNMHTTAHNSTRMEDTVATIGALNLSPSDNILRENIINPNIGSQIRINKSGISTSCNESTSTAQHKQIGTYLDKGCEYKRRIMSNGASCSSTAQETDEYGGASKTIGQYKRKLAYFDRSSEYKRIRLSDGACCSTAQDTYEYNGSLLNQYIPLQMQQHVGKEHEDHDSTIYMPKDYFPAMQDDSGQAEDMIEDNDEDDESYIFSGRGFEYVSHRAPNHAICEIQVDPYDHIYKNLPSGHHILEPVPNCTHCNAKKFQYEKPTFCCKGGKVKIVNPHVPDEMRRLYTSQDPDAKYFQDNIRYGNINIQCFFFKENTGGVLCYYDQQRPVDAVQCTHRAKPGEFRVFNQFTMS